MEEPEKPAAEPPRHTPPIPPRRPSGTPAASGTPAPTGGDRPWQNRVPTPPPPPLPPHLGGSVDLRVGKRLLWVGGAAYPLRNITRVYTFLLTPKRGEATVRFFKRLALILAVAFGLLILDGITRFGSSEDSGSITGLVQTGGLIAFVFSGVELLMVLTARAHWVLAVETSGLSTALVTSKNIPHLNELVGHVVNAIENPDVEFQVKVDTLMINPKNYQFGDNVNMYGGSGNTGMVKQ
ncbi:DUF6232 family protein [Streptomyces sp. NPDC057697]|uniref:DUF6232 family protein n=1 Tax=Streptomyces sp. NPDC057697 TaxID=3346219 RepID=UPI0036931C1D